MKLVILLTFIGLASAIATPYEWSQFKVIKYSSSDIGVIIVILTFFFQKNYDKTYSSVAEELKRAKIYLQNVKLVNEHNKRYENGEVGFSLAVNKFADLVSS